MILRSKSDLGNTFDFILRGFSSTPSLCSVTSNKKKNLVVMAQLVSSYSTFEEGQPARKFSSNSEGPISFLFEGGQFSNFRI